MDQVANVMTIIKDFNDAIFRLFKALSTKSLARECIDPLRAVSINSEKNEIHVYFYYDGEISESDEELSESAMDDIISDFHFIMTENYQKMRKSLSN